MPSPGGLLAGRTIRRLALRGWAARARGCAFAGRAARWVDHPTAGAPGMGYPWLVPSFPSVGLLAGRTIDRWEPCRQAHRTPRRHQPARHPAPAPHTLDAGRLVHGSTPSGAVPAIHRRTPRTRASWRWTSRSAVDDRVREPHTTTPSGGSDPPHRGTPADRHVRRRLIADEAAGPAPPSSGGHGLPALEFGVGLGGDGVLQRLLGGRPSERRRRHLLSSHRA
ncbi:hypothetical protein BH18CHL1_BH18CHL1_04540 [soil metagenome]